MSSSAPTEKVTGVSAPRIPPPDSEAEISTPISPSLSSAEVGFRVHSTRVAAPSSSTIPISVGAAESEPAEPTTETVSTGSASSSSLGVISTAAEELRSPAGMTSPITVRASVIPTSAAPTEQSPSPSPSLQSSVCPVMVKVSVPSCSPSEKGVIRRVTEAELVLAGIVTSRPEPPTAAAV